MVNIKDYYKLYWDKGGYSSKVEPFCLYKKKYIENCIRADSKTVLDIGCGDGEFSSILLKGNNAVFGLDISETAIDAAKNRKIHAQAHDINESFPFKDKFFDIALLFDVLEHVFDPLFILKEAYRVLRPGGALYCCVPNAAFIINRLYFLLTGHFRDFTALADNVVPDLLFSEHIRYFSPKIITMLLRKNNFAIKKVDYWFPVYFQKPPRHKLSFIGKGLSFCRADRLFPSLFSSNIFIESIKNI